MNYCLIGKGFIHQRHCDAIRDTGGKVILTCDIDPAKKADFLDYQEMFESEKFKNEVDVVVICTPNHLHKQMIKDALKTNRKVLCEKPLILDHNFTGLEGVNVVFQLRYHSLIPEIKKALNDNDNIIDMTMKVYRDENWWNSWRGQENQSGGILFSLGIHMFDFLIFMLGNEYTIIESKKSRKKCTGIIKFPTATINYIIEVINNREGQTRSFTINGVNFELCNSDNLSFSGYHDQVYREFIKGNGIPLSEAKKAIELVLKLKAQN